MDIQTVLNGDLRGKKVEDKGKNTFKVTLNVPLMPKETIRQIEAVLIAASFYCHIGGNRIRVWEGVFVPKPNGALTKSDFKFSRF